MKKSHVVTVCVLGGIAQVCAVMAIRHFLSHRNGANTGVSNVRVMMRDEDAPRAIEPSIALDVNDTPNATVFAGTPLWFTVAVTNAAAANEVAAAQVLSSRLARLAANAPERKGLEAALQRRRDPGRIGLGDATRPWTAAVQLWTRDAQNGKPAVSVPLQPLGSPPGVIQLDAVTSAQASFGTAVSNTPAGTYFLVACLGATGSWQGRTCSEPVTLSVVNRPARLTREEQNALEQQSARFALLTGNAQALEESGGKLVAADPHSIPGHMYLGEAKFQQGRWSDALNEFTIARGEFDRQRPNARERPQFLNMRIGQLIQKTP